jgi:dihydrofolate reductase
MRRIRYLLAMSLDGYIAGTKGEVDWIAMDPDIDFGTIFQQFDTILVGRRTFEGMARTGNTAMPGMKTFVFSRTLQQHDYPDVTVVGEKAEEVISAIRVKAGKDIWLFGGGSLFGSLLAAKLLDTVEVAIMPVLLGGGIPVLAPPSIPAKLTLANHRIYKSGIVSLEYKTGSIP